MAGGPQTSVEALGPSTIQPVAVSRRAPEDLREEIRDVAISMADDASDQDRRLWGFIERFVPVGPEGYERHPNDARRLRAGGFLELR